VAFGFVQGFGLICLLLHQLYEVLSNFLWNGHGLHNNSLDKPGKPHLVVSLYQPITFDISELSSSFTLYDQSKEGYPEFADLRNSKYLRVDNVGHSLANFMDYIVTEYEILPDRIAFLKSNIAGRHINQVSLEAFLEREFLTNLWLEPMPNRLHFVESTLDPTEYIQRNTGWYDPSGAKYFNSFESFFEFIFDIPSQLDWLSFSPGACYLTTRSNIRNAPRELWGFLKFISSYKFFPPEAYLVERIRRICMTTTIPFHERFSSGQWHTDLENLPKPIGSIKDSLRKRIGVLAIGFAYRLRGLD
jgi:hypothetical protein